MTGTAPDLPIRPCEALACAALLFGYAGDDSSSKADPSPLLDAQSAVGLDIAFVCTLVRLLAQDECDEPDAELVISLRVPPVPRRALPPPQIHSICVVPRSTLLPVDFSSSPSSGASSFIVLMTDPARHCVYAAAGPSLAGRSAPSLPGDPSVERGCPLDEAGGCGEGWASRSRSGEHTGAQEDGAMDSVCIFAGDPGRGGYANDAPLPDGSGAQQGEGTTAAELQFFIEGARFFAPKGIAAPNAAGNESCGTNAPALRGEKASSEIFICDSKNGELRSIDCVTRKVTTVAGSVNANNRSLASSAATSADGPLLDCRFTDLEHVAVLDGTRLFVSDQHRVREINFATGWVTTVFSNPKVIASVASLCVIGRSGTAGSTAGCGAVVLTDREVPGRIVCLGSAVADAARTRRYEELAVTGVFHALANSSRAAHSPALPLSGATHSSSVNLAPWGVCCSPADPGTVVVVAAGTLCGTAGRRCLVHIDSVAHLSFSDASGRIIDVEFPRGGSSGAGRAGAKGGPSQAPAMPKRALGRPPAGAARGTPAWNSVGSRRTYRTFSAASFDASLAARARQARTGKPRALSRGSGNGVPRSAAATKHPNERLIVATHDARDGTHVVSVTSAPDGDVQMTDSVTHCCPVCWQKSRRGHGGV